MSEKVLPTVLLVGQCGRTPPVLEEVLGALEQPFQYASCADAPTLVRAADFAVIVVHAGQQALDVTRQLHAHRRSGHTPIIVLAGDDPGAIDAISLYQAGAVDVLCGQLSPVVLRAKVSWFLDAYRNAEACRRSDEQLRTTRARLQATIDAAELATWSWDLKLDRLHVDSHLAKLFDVAPEVANGAPLSIYLRAVHPDDVPAATASIRQAIDTGKPYDVGYRVRSAGGQWRSLIARGQVQYDLDGTPALLQGVVIDVTPQRQTEERLRTSEERYRTLFDSVDVGVCIIEMLYDSSGKPCDYRFIEVNPAFVQQTGLRDAAGKTIRSMAPGHEQLWFDLYADVVATGQPLRRIEEARALGRWYDVYATRVGGPGSQLVAVLFNDIGERVRSEAELRRLADDLADADRRKTEFLATLAHELRNPLAPLRSGLQVLRLAADNPATRARVQDVMDRQLSHMVTLVDDLLDVARITRGQVKLKREPVALAALVASAVEISLPMIEAEQHRFSVEIVPEPLLLHADPTRLRQIISNLLGNAAKYTPRGGRISLTVRRDGNDAVLAVTDNGIGIAPASLEEVFAMFTQVGREQHASGGGLGIGLSLVRNLVDQHGGSVRAASPGVGLGSTFTVRLPLTTVAPPAAAPQAAAATPDSDGLRILVVDDNRDAAETLAELIGLLGHDVRVAHDGAAAIVAADAFLPQVMFLDIGMPGMDGYQLARSMRASKRHARTLLVALTGWGGADDRQRTSAAGFDLHLTKPVDLAALADVLDDYAAASARP